MRNLKVGSSALGLVTATVALSLGCAATSDVASGGDDVGSTGEAQILALGAPVIGGCNVSQMFDITSNQNQNIGFVALNGVNLNDMTAQIFSVNQQGVQTALNQTAQQTSAAMQSMLNNAMSASATVLNQTTSNNLATANQAQSSTALVNASNLVSAQNYANQSEADVTTVAHTGNASQYATGANVAAGNAYQAGATNSFNDILGAPLAPVAACGLGCGGVGIGIGIMPFTGAIGSSFNNAAAGNSQLASNTVASGSNVNDVVATNHAAQLASASGSNAAQSSNLATLNGSNAYSANANLANASALNQTATNQYLAQNAANGAQSSNFLSQGSNLSFSNLTSQNLQHVRVLVSSIASSTQQAMNVFSGANQSVFATGAFPLGIAGCN